MHCHIWDDDIVASVLLFLFSQFESPDLVGEICGFLDVVRSVTHQRCQNGGEVFGSVVGGRVDTAHNGSEWGSLFVYPYMQGVASPG